MTVVERTAHLKSMAPLYLVKSLLIQTPKHLEKVVLSLMQRPWLPPLALIKVSKTASGTSAGFTAVYVDGKMLVDKVNDSQDWRWCNYLEPPLTDYPPSNVFDGDSSTLFACDGGTATFSFTNLTIQTSLRLLARGEDGNLAVTLGGTQQQITTDTNQPPTWRTVTISGPVSLDSIDIASSAIGLYLVEADGVLLVDRGLRNLGDSKVSTTTAKQDQARSQTSLVRR